MIDGDYTIIESKTYEIHLPLESKHTLLTSGYIEYFEIPFHEQFYGILSGMIHTMNISNS